MAFTVYITNPENSPHKNLVPRFIPGPFFSIDKRVEYTQDEIDKALENVIQFKDYHDAWWFLIEHPAFLDEYGLSHFTHDLEIDVMKINPHIGRVDSDANNNTQIEIWIEHGCYNIDAKECCHDFNLDCGGDNFEDAIMNLARLVALFYGTWEFWDNEK